MRCYVTFGADHSHQIGGVRVGSGTVCTYQSDHGEAVARAIFGRDYCSWRPAELFDHTMIQRWGLEVVEIPAAIVSAAEEVRGRGYVSQR